MCDSGVCRRVCLRAIRGDETKPHFLLGGSTNDSVLGDDSGSRRFVPIVVPTVGIRRDVIIGRIVSALLLFISQSSSLSQGLRHRGSDGGSRDDI